MPEVNKPSAFQGLDVALQRGCENPGVAAPGGVSLKNGDIEPVSLPVK